MPTEQPNDAPDTLKPTDRETAAAVLNDETLDRPPGGGGLGGASAADSLGGSQRAPGGASPNAPIDTGVAAGASPDKEAQVRALDEVTTRGAPAQR